MAHASHCRAINPPSAPMETVAVNVARDGARASRTLPPPQAPQPQAQRPLLLMLPPQRRAHRLQANTAAANPRPRSNDIPNHRPATAARNYAVRYAVRYAADSAPT